MSKKAYKDSPARQILLDTLTFGYDLGQGLDKPRGYNINEAEQRLDAAIEIIVGIKMDEYTAELRANHERLVKKLEELEAKYGKPAR